MLRFFDGGGLYYTVLTDKWDASTSGGSTASVDTGTNGRWGGRCLSFVDVDPNAGTSGASSVSINMSGSLSEYVLQFAYNCTVANTNSFQLCSFYEGTTPHIDLRINVTNNTFTTTRNGTILGTSANNAWSTTAGWRYCQLRVKVHDTTGTIDVIQDGVTIFALTGQDTRNGGTGIIDVIRIGPHVPFVNGQLHNFKFQDIAICDVTGSAPMNGIHNEGRVRLITPNGEGDTNNWTPSTGTDNAALVDEIPNNGNTDYNSSTAVNDIDLYTLTDLPVTPTTIYGVTVANMVAKDDAGTDHAASIVKTGGTVFVGSDVTISSATFVKVLHLWEANPNTTSAWTKSEIDALQAGIKRTA
jgi:hypothetical protein